MKTVIIMFISSIILISSCQNAEQHSKIQNLQDEKNKAMIDLERRNKVFAERYKHSSDFLYLHYWINMNKSEFDVITDSLIKAKSLFIKNYKLATKILDDTLYISPSFISEKLVKIVLECNSDFNDDFLQLYKAKYGNYSIQKPKPDRYVMIDGSVWDHTKNVYGTYYRFVQYIWVRKDLCIAITDNYCISIDEIVDLTNDGMPSKHIPYSNTYQISYVSKPYFISKLQREALDKNALNKDHIKRIQKAKELI